MSAEPILVIEHQADCPPAHVGEWLTEAGCDLQVCRPYAGDALPDELPASSSWLASSARSAYSAYSGLLVLGGTMGANDDATVPWLSGTKALLRAASDAGLPTLGICLGHQLTAVALGGVVRPDPLGKSVGVLPVGWCADAKTDPLLGPLVGEDTLALHWNNDTVVGLPSGAVVLARGPNARVQAARFAPSVWGVQWHPEAGDAVVAEWAAHDRPTAAERGIDVDAALGDVRAHGRRLVDTWRPLARRFAQLCADRQG